MRVRICYVLIFVLLLAAPGFGQGIQIRAQLLNPTLRVFFLSDFNFTGRGTAAGDIFELVLENQDLTDPIPKKCTLSLRIYSDNLGDLAFGQTGPFDLKQYEIIRITNRNLFTQAQIFSLQDYSIESAGNKLKDKVLATGKLPSDRYFFEFILQDESGYVPTPAIIYIDVTNPSTLDLISPGGPADRGEIVPLFTNLPLFRWSSDMTRFRLRISEKLPVVHDDAGPEEIMNDRIRFEQEFSIDPDDSEVAELLPTTAYQYPSAGVWSLEQGKIYYWQMTGIVGSSAAFTELPSEIWSFQVMGPDALASGGGNAYILSLLRMLLGDDFSALLGSSGVLAGFNPTGTFLVNGKPISLAELQQILSKIASGEYELISAICE